MVMLNHIYQNVFHKCIVFRVVLLVCGIDELITTMKYRVYVDVVVGLLVYFIQVAKVRAPYMYMW